MLDVHLPAPKQRIQGFVMPREYIICIRIVNGWTMTQAAAHAEITPTAWSRWERGQHRVQGGAWKYLLMRCGLSPNWRPTADLCRYASTLVKRSRCVKDILRNTRENCSDDLMATSSALHNLRVDQRKRSLRR